MRNSLALGAVGQVLQHRQRRDVLPERLGLVQILGVRQPDDIAIRKLHAERHSGLEQGTALPGGNSLDVNILPLSI